MHIVPERGALPLALLLPVSGRTHVARLDGRRMPDADAVFQQFYDRLKLPDHFGWNWDALSDCLRDLGWLSADHHVLIVEAAENALPGDVAGQKTLLRILARAGRRWSCPQRPEGIRLSRFVVVLSCDATAVPYLQEQLRSCAEETALP
jgi:RNAse (barnase) inhibitor barstar